MATSAASPRSPLRFCLLVFALSLPFWLAGAIAERRGFQPGFPMNLPVSALMAFCPLVAAVILVHRAEGSTGVKRLLRRVLDYRRIEWRWYLPIVFLNPAILLGSYGVMRWLGRPLPDPQVPLAAAPLLLLVFLPPAVGEEAGWMGYAADPLQDRWGALRAGLLLGTLGALWHVVPLVQAHHDTAWIAWKCLETLAARVLIVWLYNNTRRSLFAAVLFHALSNVGVSLFPNGGSHYDPAVAAVLTGVAAGIVTFLWGAKTLARFRPGLTRPGSSAAPGELEQALPASTRARPGRRR
jgi:membrane protease YdiL (CAAX protease family)